MKEFLKNTKGKPLLQKIHILIANIHCKFLYWNYPELYQTVKRGNEIVGVGNPKMKKVWKEFARQWNEDK